MEEMFNNNKNHFDYFIKNKERLIKIYKITENDYNIVKEKIINYIEEREKQDEIVIEKAEREKQEAIKKAEREKQEAIEKAEREKQEAIEKAECEKISKKPPDVRPKTKKPPDVRPRTKKPPMYDIYPPPPLPPKN